MKLGEEKMVQNALSGSGAGISVERNKLVFSGFVSNYVIIERCYRRSL
jgi:hypothetical protein